jgi:hypothetical protein
MNASFSDPDQVGAVPQEDLNGEDAMIYQSQYLKVPKTTLELEIERIQAEKKAL